MRLQQVTLSQTVLEEKQKFFTRHNPKGTFTISSSQNEGQNQFSKLVQKYLEEVYHIKVPDNFKRRFISAHTIGPQKRNFIAFVKIVDVIVFSCNIWKQYLLSEEDFSNLVCNELIKYVSIHCSAISPYSLKQKKYLHLNCSKFPDPKQVSIVTQEGLLKVYP